MTITAPISGYVQRRLKAPGDKVMPGGDNPGSAHVLSLYDPKKLQVRVDVPLADALTYAPPAGRPGLRELWREKLVAENPSLRGKAFGLPIVTSAITHGLMLAGDLFVGEGDRILLPDKLWGNYRLLYEVRLGGKIVTFPFYAGDGFNTEGFAQALADASGRLRLPG